MKLVLLNLLTGTLLFYTPIFAQTGGFCKALFGSKAELTLEPKEANKGGVTDGVLGHKKVPIANIPDAKGFRCIISLDSQSGSCPKGMKNIKANNVETCSSKEYPLKDLCPSEIEEYSPGSSAKICRSQGK